MTENTVQDPNNKNKDDQKMEMHNMKLIIDENRKRSKRNKTRTFFIIKTCTFVFVVLFILVTFLEPSIKTSIKRDLIRNLEEKIEILEKKTPVPPCLFYNEKADVMQIASEGQCQLLNPEGIKPEQTICFYKVKIHDYNYASVNQCEFIR